VARIPGFEKIECGCAVAHLAPDDPVGPKAQDVEHQGEFLDRWPKGFFEERAEELF
jgi:hypothetical protein